MKVCVHNCFASLYIQICIDCSQMRKKKTFENIQQKAKVDTYYKCIFSFNMVKSIFLHWRQLNIRADKQKVLKLEIFLIVILWDCIKDCIVYAKYCWMFFMGHSCFQDLQKFCGCFYQEFFIFCLQGAI